MANSIIKAVINIEDAKFIESNLSEIQDVWDKRQIYRTETEVRVSVLNDLKFPTIASKYWQAVRELSGFYASLVSLSFTYRRGQVKQEQVEKDISEESCPLKVRLLKIDLEEALFSQLGMEQEAKDRMREIRLWCTILEECKQADPNFDYNDPNTHQLRSYTMRFQNQVANLNDSSSLGEVSNLTGQLETALRHKTDPSIGGTATPKIGDK